MESLPIPDELLADIFLRLSTPADLVRASAACTSFCRVLTHLSFLQQYRRLHAPPLLGLLKDRAFYPAVPPHPSAAAAGAVALAADFSFSFLPPPACDWVVRDSRDGRVLLDRPRDHRNHFTADWQIVGYREIAVCDPFHRRYLVLPQVPQDLAAATVEEFLLRSDAFLIPADDDRETSFGVVWMWQGRTMLVAFVFSSSTRQWRAVRSRIWIDLFPGLILSAKNAVFSCRTYAYGCFYWVTNSRYWKEEMKMLVFNTRRMEFSIAEPPPEAKRSSSLDINVAIVEAGEGRPGMFVLESTPSDINLHYTIMQNSGGSSSQWQREKTISLSPGYWYLSSGSARRFLLLIRLGKPFLEATCFTLDIKTFKLQRMCGEQSGHAYSNFPPLLLSSPTVSSGTPEGAEAILEQGVEVLRVGEAIHADAGGWSGVSRTGDSPD